ncbi:hypothetical protein ACFYV7_28170 [Nocardia suismassiliense]|uniref:Uncharacterized protein n=1 Tax=Nocardia suismassiliense TaxID=2077092 RepID=A0ABW6R0V4_9NOCA
MGIVDPSCVNSCTDRRMTCFEHVSVIQQEYGLASFAEAEAAAVTDQTRRCARRDCGRF